MMEIFLWNICYLNLPGCLTSEEDGLDWAAFNNQLKEITDLTVCF